MSKDIRIKEHILMNYKRSIVEKSDLWFPGFGVERGWIRKVHKEMFRILWMFCIIIAEMLSWAYIVFKSYQNSHLIKSSWLFVHFCKLCFSNIDNLKIKITMTLHLKQLSKKPHKIYNYVPYIIILLCKWPVKT